MPVAGLIATTRTQSIGSAIEDILFLAQEMTAEEFRSFVVAYLPL